MTYPQHMFLSQRWLAQPQWGGQTAWRWYYPNSIHLQEALMPCLYKIKRWFPFHLKATTQVLKGFGHRTQVLTGHSFTKDTSLGILILISRNGIRFFFQKTTGGMTKLASDNMSILGATVDSLVGIDLWLLVVISMLGLGDVETFFCPKHYIFDARTA